MAITEQGERKTGGIRRALVAALALYALVLAGFTAGLKPPLGMPGGQSANFEVICGHAAGDRSAPTGPNDHDACCLLACAASAALNGGVAAPPRDFSVSPPSRPAILVRWAHPAAVPQARGTLSRPTARGPPSFV